jgi:hypothetical protein
MSEARPLGRAPVVVDAHGPELALAHARASDTANDSAGKGIGLTTLPKPTAGDKL